ncbi:allophanate hydrolase subunit 1 [Vibrio parahaemolyticus]|uniref:5-oxoprolinase subunit B family protein n=1 Tax=Vibrio parahaemolyticus TaxID=670 RepID=UPI001C4F7E41|nr:allophanate hydrolase subunit 1 [Vibrio parahaemolyticus]EGQ8129468.1 allophanate hydrolase subunit 1 [Vibrio parahaemolyticus]EGQ8280262.1 carboxyltransferase domain-containing protein [Vibrio parahaemolyticus]EGQ8716182.1 carboxyltransferase domain-containing protein [Vibrio parahaemolyticus]EGQ8809573.1 carboxyltransferase domain-containing protein [Vibrio parahaemolyticus]EGQ8834163.1 carboxyltransferase domain-containing protein [Vibrio parahaemolyticus]
MHQTKFSIDLVSECSILIRFDETISENSIGQLARAMNQHLSHIVMNIVPSYRTVLIDYLPFRISEFQLVDILHNILVAFDPNKADKAEPNEISIPVYYSEETALDLERFEEQGIDLGALIDAHTKPVYTVSAIGFAPGFAFLSDVEDSIAMPRLKTPRTFVPSGSVGIADSKTAVYPSDSPGGWNIIGRSPLSLFSDTPPFIPFEVGDKVTFYTVSKQEFLELGGSL